MASGHTPRPRHPASPGILTYEDHQGLEHYIALDEGILLKSAVRPVSAHRAVVGDDLDTLRDGWNQP